MSPSSKEILLTKFERLEEYLTALDRLAAFSESQFLLDPTLGALAERYLHLSIEILLDAGKMVLAERQFSKANNNYEIFEILNREKVLEPALFNRVKKMPGFRNILVHNYMKIDPKLVYQNLINGRADIREFRDVILKEFCA